MPDCTEAKDTYTITLISSTNDREYHTLICMSVPGTMPVKLSILTNNTGSGCHDVVKFEITGVTVHHFSTSARTIIHGKFVGLILLISMRLLLGSGSKENHVMSDELQSRTDILMSDACWILACNVIVSHASNDAGVIGQNVASPVVYHDPSVSVHPMGLWVMLA